MPAHPRGWALSRLVSREGPPHSTAVTPHSPRAVREAPVRDGNTGGVRQGEHREGGDCIYPQDGAAPTPPEYSEPYKAA